MFSRFLLGLLLCCAVLQSVQAEELDFERYQDYCSYSQGERALLSDLEDGRLDQFSLARAAMTIARHSDSEILAAKAKLKRSIRKLRSEIEQSADQNLVAKIFNHLHVQFLKGKYDPHLYDVHRTIEGTEFNCLTATILFHEICEEFSIPSQTRWEPSHVRCWIPITSLPGSGYGVETTARNVADALGSVERESKQADRRLTHSQLIAKVFYNRGVVALKQQDYPTALAATWASSLLDANDEPAQSNLRACFNNWALNAAAASEKTRAAKLFDEGLQLDPTYQPFLRNRTILIGR